MPLGAVFSTCTQYGVPSAALKDAPSSGHGRTGSGLGDGRQLWERGSSSCPTQSFTRGPSHCTTLAPSAPLSYPQVAGSPEERSQILRDTPVVHVSRSVSEGGEGGREPPVKWAAPLLPPGRP